MMLKIDWLTLVSLEELETGKGSSAYANDTLMNPSDFLHYVRSSLELWQFGEKWEYDQPLSHARVTVISDMGAKVSLLYTGHVMITLTGSSCREYDHDELVSLIFRMRRKWHITRIDVAADMQPDMVTAAEVWSDAGDSSALGRKRQTQLIISATGLATAYFGSRTSDTFVRVYDKEYMEGARVLRFEVEVKGRLARNLLDGIDDTDDLKARLSYLCVRGENLVNSRVLSGELEKFQRELPIPYKAERASDLQSKLRWFDDQVIPSFVSITIADIEAAEEIIRRMRNIAF
jgi:DNA relaxase NicK